MPKRKLYKCKLCEHETSERVDKWQHIKTHVTPEKLLTCDSCPFVTEYKHHLEYHQRNHNNYKPFKCEQCDYQCVNRSMLKSHSKSHSSIYPYQCGQCRYATKYAHSLKMHLKKYCHQMGPIKQNQHDSPVDEPKLVGAVDTSCKKENVELDQRHNHHHHHNTSGSSSNSNSSDTSKHGASSTSPEPSSSTRTSTTPSTPASSTTPISITPLSVTAHTFERGDQQMDILDLRISSKLQVST